MTKHSKKKKRTGKKRGKGIADTLASAATARVVSKVGKVLNDAVLRRASQAARKIAESYADGLAPDFATQYQRRQANASAGPYTPQIFSIENLDTRDYTPSKHVYHPAFNPHPIPLPPSPPQKPRYHPVFTPIHKKMGQGIRKRKHTKKKRSCKKHK